MSKRTYKAVDFHQVDWAAIAHEVSQGRVVFAVDVAKNDFVGVLMTGDGQAVKTLKWRHPRDTRALVDCLEQLPAALEVVFEPTGTYGDALCYQLQRAGMVVYQLAPKRTADAQELYDGVPSRHDGKSAHVIAWLHLQGLSRRWRERGESRRALAAQSNQLGFCQDQAQRTHNRLEAQLARHWPEAGELFQIESTSLLELLSAFGSPGAVAADAEAARALLARTGGHFLNADKIEALIDSARMTVGMDCLDAEAQVIQQLAAQLLELKRQRQRLEKALAAASEGQPALEAMREAVGAVTAAVLYAELGDPGDYPHAGSYLKAAGLYLKEHSSGKYQSPLRLTKRGPASVRRYLFFAVLRWIRQAGPARRWYEAKVARDGGVKMKAIGALMRKLTKALWYVGQGEVFDPSRLFDESKLAGAA